MQPLSHLNSLSNKMTKEILLDPTLLVGYRILLFIFDVKIVCPFFVKKLVLCVNYLEPTHLVCVSSSEELSFGNKEKLTPCIIDHFLYESSLEF